jgi:membrane protein YqaA with SNARE-associated domain
MLPYLNGLMDFLVQTANDPITYSIVFFLYTILATVILPIPVEVGLLLSPNTSYLWLALIFGLGKMLGSVVVFYLGLGLGDRVRTWMESWQLTKWLIHGSEVVIDKLHYAGLYLILSIPIMPDTVPLYIFSVLNEHEVFKVEYFAVINLMAGVTRAFVLFSLMYLFGVNLFQ